MFIYAMLSEHRDPSSDDLGVFGVISKKAPLDQVYREAADGHRARRLLRLARAGCDR
jgi:hypothetical protein